LEEIRERERGRERDMLDLSSEDGWQWSKFRIGKHARQDPNGVRGHGMARLPRRRRARERHGRSRRRRWRRPRAVRVPLALAPTPSSSPSRFGAGSGGGWAAAWEVSGGRGRGEGATRGGEGGRERRGEGYIAMARCDSAEVARRGTC